MEIILEKFEDDEVIGLLKEHLVDMHAHSPPESVHALDIDALQSPDITFWSARVKQSSLGCIALKQLTPEQGEIKSMRTRSDSRGQGIGARLLEHLLKEAQSRGYTQLNLETGSMDFFKPARKLYLKYGFYYCGPFGSYIEDPNSLFMELKLE